MSGSGPRGVEEGVTAKLPDLDLAIMNPPFTRSVGGNLLFGSLPTDERRKLQDELSRRLKSRQASATAGLGSAFVAAASPKLRPGEGRLALVLPITVCTGPSWEQTRSLIEKDFVLDIVITSHDPLRWNFSDSTDLSEALLIATRRSDESPSAEHRTVFVNLWQNPDGVCWTLTGLPRQLPRRCQRDSRRREPHCWKLTASTSARCFPSQNPISPERSGQVCNLPAPMWCAAHSSYWTTVKFGFPAKWGLPKFLYAGLTDSVKSVPIGVMCGTDLNERIR